MPRSPESVEQWRARDRDQRKEKRHADASRRQAALELARQREQRRDRIATRLADVERQAMAQWREQLAVNDEGQEP